MTPQDRLKQWLADEGRKHSWLADQCKVDGSTLTRWLTGATTPHPLAQAELERVTGIPASVWVKA